MSEPEEEGIETEKGFKPKASTILETIHAMDRVFFVSMIARVQIGQNRQKIYAHSGYYSESFQTHAENKVRAALLEKIMKKEKPVVSLPKPDQNSRRERNSLGLGNALDPIGDSIEFDISEARNAPPEEFAKFAELGKFAKPDDKD